MQKNYLNELYSQYADGKIGCRELEGLIYSYFINNQDKTYLKHWNRQEYEDYISWFYNRLKRAIDSYSDTGSSFEAFINKYLQVSSKEYSVRIVTQRVTEYSAWNARIPDLYVREEAPCYIHENDKNIIAELLDRKNGRVNKRRILTLILKYYYYVSDDFIEKTAPKIGIDGKELGGMIDKLRQKRQERDNKIYEMQERIFCQYYRCIVFEKRLSYIQENTGTYIRLKLRLEKARQRLEKMRKRLAQIRTEATNSQIAEVIGIKKGTVDANLHKLKNKLKSIMEAQ